MVLMRVVAGSLRGRVVIAPEGESTRPTTDRARQATFNSLDSFGFVNEAKVIVEKEVSLPQGYYIEWGGNFKNLIEARKRLLILTPLALAIVLMMIYATFHSLAQTLLIFTCVPLALVGGVISLILNGLPFSISAGVGFIALSGIAVLNGVVLINYYNHLG